LHAGFLMREVRRTYFVPLDRLDLEDTSKRPRGTLAEVRFGPCRIALLDKSGIAGLIPEASLQRFGDLYAWPARLSGFYWLIIPTTEPAGPIWERSWMSILYKPVGAIGHVPLYPTRYPEPVEDALFTVLLCLVKTPSGEPWQPFFVPWVYSITDDPFAEPPRAPNPARLTWTLVGDENDEIEVPDRSECFKVTPEVLEAALQQRWERLQTASSATNANLHPLTKHFFVKALFEEGIDEIVANLSCIEATLMLPEPNGRRKMRARYKRLVRDARAEGWLEQGYRLRDDYLHSLGSPSSKITWEQLGSTRWSVVRAVDEYLACTQADAHFDRRQLLLMLSNETQ
jgi:hypothetical protein